jgi:hypothetical protein
MSCELLGVLLTVDLSSFRIFSRFSLNASLDFAWDYCIVSQWCVMSEGKGKGIEIKEVTISSSSASYVPKSDLLYQLVHRPRVAEN